jgi:hypothetical protein
MIDFGKGLLLSGLNLLLCKGRLEGAVMTQETRYVYSDRTTVIL